MGGRGRAAQPGEAERAVAEVAVDVAAGPAAPERAVADHLIAGDRAEALVVRTLDHRRHGARGATALVAAAALEDIPAEVVSAAGRQAAVAAGHVVDLLDLVLTDVADHEAAVAAVEGEAVRVPQPVCVDLGSRTRSAAERVVRRNRVAAVRTRVDADQLPEHAAEVLSVLVRVAAAATVAEARVEHAVGADLKLAALVVGAVMRDPEHRPAR